MPYQSFFTFSFIWLSLTATAQDSTLQLPQGYLPAVEKRAGELTQKLDSKTKAYLAKFQKQEARLLRKLSKKDSTKAKALVAASQAKYQELEQALKGKPKLQEYLPSFDTLQTTLKYLSQHPEGLVKTKEGSQELAQTMNKVEGLQSALGKTEVVQQFLQERKAQLTEQLKGLPFAKDLQKLSKQAYYYKAQVGEYKALLKDKKKLEQKALELLSKTKAFQSFMRKNSQLASLFRLPGAEDGNSAAASLQGLQTRQQVNSLLQERFGNDPSTIAQLKQNVQAAQGELNSLKRKAESLQSGSVGNTGNAVAQPNFKPNGQKTRSFRQRLEIGTNMQSQKARWNFPVTSDLGLSIGYKLSDKGSIGVGGAYKLGLGTGWQHIQLTHQGIGLRSYVEYQLKRSFYLSGGYEQNYRPLLREAVFTSPFGGGREGAAWQSSGLIGVSKKYSVSKKLRGQMQLLWDFLSYQQMPRSQAILFRIGYNLK